MADIKNTIYKIEANSLSGFRGLSNNDLQLVTSAEITKTFKPNDNFIELSYFTLDDVRLLTIPSYSNYSVLSGDTQDNNEGNTEISIDAEQDYKSYGFEGSEVKALYNFLDYPYSNTLNPQDFFIESISPDRRELRLLSINLDAEVLEDITSKLIDKYSNDVYNPDFYLYFGDNIFLTVVNIDQEEYRNTNAVLIKLYNPLPNSVKVKTRVNVVEKVADSIAYEINSETTLEEPEIPTLRGANFSVEVEEQTTEPSQYFNYEELFGFPTNNSNRELNSLFNEKGSVLGIDYSDYSNFINFSSAEERIRNFKYKLDLIDSYQASLDIINSTGNVYPSSGVVGSKAYYENLLNNIVNNFDHYERHLYFEIGPTSWPKVNSTTSSPATKPYINESSNLPDGSPNTVALSWYNSELQDAILYDAQNPNILTNTIPAYLKEDTSNEPYNLFIHMIGQHFDNLWIYTDAVSDKYNADNRLTRGVSKDLVEELLKNFGVKLYTSNKSVEDLFRYFTTNSYESGEEYLPNSIITSGEQPISQNDYQKEIYKRIYHNLPLLLKSKGTERGVRALINCFGIPSDVLKIKVYGGQSAEELPYFGGEQAWTSSLDKVRLDNTGSIVPGDTLSYYTGILNSDNKYTQDLHRVEIGFSPADDINAYIISQSAVLFPDHQFNIDDYIGDPREITTNTYLSLESYADLVFENLSYYNLKDFVRLIKFFDNVIFRMVRDFVPARSVTDAGIIIKPHLLDRSKYSSPVMSWTQPEYSGSIDTAFITSSNAGAYENIGFGSEGHTKFKKESVTRVQYPTQTPIGRRRVRDKEHEEPKFNGELYNSFISISNGELNADNPFKNLQYPDVKYEVQFYLVPPDDACLLSSQDYETLILDPLLPNNSLANYNLSTLFVGSGPQYDYTVTTNGTSQTLIEGDIYYNFNQSGNYDQYQVFEIEAFHQANDEDFNGTCINSREVKLVACDIDAIVTNLPQQLLVTDQYDLSTWWNSDESPNTDVSYIIDGVSYDSSEVGEFNFPSTSGNTVEVVIQDNHNPTVCNLELNLSFTNCTLQPVLGGLLQGFGQAPVLPGGEYIDFLNMFLGAADGVTQYYFRLEYTDVVNIGPLGTQLTVTSPPSHIGFWNPVQTSTGGIGLTIPVPVDIDDLFEVYPLATEIDFDQSDPDLSNPTQTFITIQDEIDNNTQPLILYQGIRIRFKAENSEDCTLEHPNSYFLVSEPEPVVYNGFLAYLNLMANNSNYQQCCTQSNWQVTIYAAGFVSISQLLASAFVSPFNVPTEPIYLTDEGPIGAYADQGWYTDGEIACFWNNNGITAMWGGCIFDCETNPNTSAAICYQP